MTTTSPQRVVIIGAGYAGVLAANRIQASLTPTEREHVRVTLISSTGDFIERVRLHEVAAGVRTTAAIPLSEMLHAQIQLIVGTVTLIDADSRTLTVAQPSAVEGGPGHIETYTSLVYAVGSTAALGAPGAAEYAHLLSNVDGAESARLALAAGQPGQRVVVVGGGATGVEAAAEIAEQYPQATVTLVSRGAVLGHLSASSQKSVTRALTALGVHLHQGAGVSRVLEHSVELSEGTAIPSDVTVWTASFAVPDLARRSGLRADSLGRLLVDEELRALDHPEILGAGDAVRPPASVGAHLRMGCAIALPLGAHAADNILAELRGKPLTALSAGFAVQCISLGRKRGLIQLVSKADVPRAFRLTGRTAARVKEYVCAVIATGSPRRERTHPGSLKSPAGPKLGRTQRAS